jgi:hypothetical protein
MVNIGEFSWVFKKGHAVNTNSIFMTISEPWATLFRKHSEKKTQTANANAGN